MNYAALRAVLAAPNGYKNVPKRDKIRIVRAAGRGDRNAQGLLVLLYGGFARKCAIEFARDRGLDIDELSQEALLGMLHAATVWDPKRGAFTTYAKWWALSYMQRAPISGNTPIRVPLNARYAKGTQVYARNARCVVSLDAPLSDSDGRTLLDVLAETSEESEPVSCFPREALECLPPKQRETIEAVYFGGKTQRDIAKLETVTRQAISLRVEKALGKLRKHPQIKALRT